MDINNDNLKNSVEPINPQGSLQAFSNKEINDTTQIPDINEAVNDLETSYGVDLTSLNDHEQTSSFDQQLENYRTKQHNLHNQWRSQPDFWSCRFFCVYRPYKESISKEMTNIMI